MNERKKERKKERKIKEEGRKVFVYAKTISNTLITNQCNNVEAHVILFNV
jgi:hypothetical protein